MGMKILYTIFNKDGTIRQDGIITTSDQAKAALQSLLDEFSGNLDALKQFDFCISFRDDDVIPKFG